MAATVNLGLAGAGRIGAVHARTVGSRVPGARIVAVADPSLTAARRLAEELGVERVLEDSVALVRDRSVDAIMVCSSTESHVELVVEAARAGKDVFCEKPLAIDLEDIDRALAAVGEAGTRLQVGFNRRFDPDFARLRALVAEGAVGGAQLLRITSRDPEPPPVEYVERSGGLFLDMLIHDFDMARFLVGAEVEEVFAAAAVLVDPAIGEAGDVDTAVVTLRFEGGCLGTIDNSRRAVYGYDQRAEVFGSRGMVSNRNRAATTAVRAGPEGSVEPPPLRFFMDRYIAAYEAQLASFVAALQSDREPAVTGEDARRATLLALAAKRSVAEGRPVRLAEGP